MTEEDNQASSYELQVQNYTKMIQENPEWEFAGIFADEGISGTAVLSLEDRNEQECLRWRYIDVIEDEEGNRKHLTWRDVALRVYRKDDENAIRATTRLHKRALESIYKKSGNHTNLL